MHARDLKEAQSTTQASFGDHFHFQTDIRRGLKKLTIVIALHLLGRSKVSFPSHSLIQQIPPDRPSPLSSPTLPFHLYWPHLGPFKGRPDWAATIYTSSSKLLSLNWHRHWIMSEVHGGGLLSKHSYAIKINVIEYVIYILNHKHIRERLEGHVYAVSIGKHILFLFVYPALECWYSL